MHTDITRILTNEYPILKGTGTNHGETIKNEIQKYIANANYQLFGLIKQKTKLLDKKNANPNMGKVGKN